LEKIKKYELRFHESKIEKEHFINWKHQKIFVHASPSTM